ncbi:MAG TPA: chromosomal replication initiator protein DnaA [Rhizobiaceae bacterium]|nr:chromosomal replication initiator protein DnaA [Rhizobiaceae bacterium]
MEVAMVNAGKPGGPGKDEQWLRIRAQLQARLGSEVFNSWFGRVKLESISGGVALHSVPTAFLKSWLYSHYRELLLELWRKEDPSVLRADVAVRSAVRRSQIAPCEEKTPEPGARVAEATAAAGEPRIQAVRTSASFAPVPRLAQHAIDRKQGFSGSPLDPRHTFANFIDGKSNRIAYAAARTVAEDDKGSVRFNPLFVHASVGLGKTHLLQAVAWEARTRDPRKKVLYLTAEYFMWRFAAAIRDQTALSLKESLRDIDLLVIDDMQFLQGKAIQAEFCHLLNELIDSARQVVVAADRPPAELESLDERVRSRLKGGVTLEVESPDYELRKAILNARYEEARAEQPSLDIPEDIRHYVARQVTTSGRDVEGAFNQLLVQHRFSEGPMSFEELDKMLGHLIRSSDSRRVRIEDIQKVVARQFNVSKNDLLSNRRTRVIVRPRQIAMYLSKIMTPRSLPEIGRRFGGRDHTTVLHAVRKIEDLASKDQKLAHEIELLKRLILD